MKTNRVVRTLSGLLLAASATLHAAYTANQTAHFLLGTSPQQIAFDGQSIWMTNYSDGTVPGTFSLGPHFAHKSTAGTKLQNACTPASASPCPSIITIDPPGSTATNAIQINDQGIIIGYYLDSSLTVRGFIREPDGTYLTVDAPGAGQGSYLGTHLWSINTEGDIAGTFFDQNAAAHSFLRKRDGRITVFDPPGGVNINAADTIAGTYFDPSAGIPRGFLRSWNGGFEPFDVSGNETFTGSIDCLNAAGDVAGQYLDSASVNHAQVRLSNGTFVQYEAPQAGTGPGQGTLLAGVNDRGEIVGASIDQNNVWHGLLGGRSGDVETFDVPGAGTGQGQGTVDQNINSRGDTAGYYFDANYLAHGFLRYGDGTITTFDFADAVGGLFPNNNNFKNAIVGYYVDASGNQHGFLRTPPDTSGKP